MDLAKLEKDLWVFDETNPDFDVDGVGETLADSGWPQVACDAVQRLIETVPELVEELRKRRVEW